MLVQATLDFRAKRRHAGASVARPPSRRFALLSLAMLSPLLAACSLFARPVEPPPPLAAQSRPARSPAPAYLPRVDAAPAPDLAVEGQVGGATWAVAARGDIAYVGVGPRIIAYDVRPTDRGDAPLALAKSAVLGRSVRDLLVDGDKLYAAVGGAGVALFDIADPARIAPVSERDLGAEAGSLALDGGRLYVTLGEGGVAVLDTFDRRLPELGRWLAPKVGSSPSIVYDIAPDDPLAFAAVDRHGLLILDINAPDRIAVLGEVTADGEARRVSLVGRTAWVAMKNGEVHVYDLRDPVRPRKFAQPDHAYGSGGEEVAAGFSLAGDHLAISGGPLEVWDVADPFTPRLLGTDAKGLPSGGHAQDGGDGVAFVTDRLVVADGVTGAIDVFDIADPMSPRWTVTLPGMRDEWRSVLFGAPDGHTLYSREYRFEIGQPSDPRLVGSNPIGSGIDLGACCGRGTVVTDGLMAYIVGNDEGAQLSAYDLADPAGPKRVGVVDDRAADQDWGGITLRGWKPSSIAKSGDRIVLAGCCSLAVVDATDPTALRLLAVRGTQLRDAIHAPSPAPAVGYTAIALTDDGRTAVGVDAGRDRGWNPSDHGGIQAIDLADPSNPRFGAHIEVPFEQLDVAIQGHHAFVAAGKGGLRVYDIADVDKVREVGVWDEGDERAVAIEMAWPQALLARSKRLDLIDIRDPGHPARLASVSVPGVVKALRLYRGRAWVLTEDAGLLGYRFR